jgi:hypothetical protein
MADLPEIGASVHYVGDEPGCVELVVHSHMTPTHLELADTLPSTDPTAPQRSRTAFAVASDTREPGTWHAPCQ